MLYPTTAPQTDPDRPDPLSYELEDEEKKPQTSRGPQIRRILSASKTYKRMRSHYDTLTPDKTRLIVLARFDPADPAISIHLKEVTFDKLAKGKYEALSYHWGAENDLKPIFLVDSDLKPIVLVDDLNRQLHMHVPSYTTGDEKGDNAHTRHQEDLATLARRGSQAYLLVRSNLYDCLLRLRLPNEDRELWIDAICINQDSQSEKQSQVEKMDQIYSNADHVLVWLGAGDTRTDKAIDFVRTKLLPRPGEVENLVRREEHADEWRSLLHLMRREWFTRRWIIQELVLSRSTFVYCGKQVINWVDLRDAMIILADNFAIIRTSLARCHETDAGYHAPEDLDALHAKKLVAIIGSLFREHQLINGDIQRESLKGLEFLISTLCNYDCTDPRDAINCFRSIAKETYGTGSTRLKGLQAPRVDYSADLLEVYVTFVRWVVEDTGTLDIICRRWALPERETEAVHYERLIALPSWIQTVDESDRRSSLSGHRRHGDSFVGDPGQPNYKACGSTKAEVDFPELKKKISRRSTDDQAAGSTGRSHTNGPTPRVVVSYANMAQQGSLKLTPDGSAPSDASDEYTQNLHVVGKSFDDIKVDMPPFLHPSVDQVEIQVQGSSLAPYDNARRNSQTSQPLSVVTSIPRTLNTTSAVRGESFIRTIDRPRRSSISIYPRSPVASAFEEFIQEEEKVIAQLLRHGIDASISIKGLIIGEISIICPPTTDGAINKAALYELFGKKTKLTPQIPVPERAWQTLVAERGADGRNPPPLWSRCCRIALRHLNRNNDLNIKEIRSRDDLQSLMPLLGPFLQRVEAVTWDRCFFKAKNLIAPELHLNGFGPNGTTKGDKLCILYGCSVPCILRPREYPEIGHYYSLVGEAYVYGVMDGEIIDSLTSEQLEQRSTKFQIL